MSLDSLVHRIRPAAGEAAGALLLLHGRGTDEGDLFSVLDFLDPDKRLVGATARAPLTLPPGGYHWYAVHRIGFPEPDTFLSTFDLLSGWVDAFLADQGVPADRLVVGGFSQGGVMSHALTLGPGRPRPAGLLAMSTFMPTVEGFELDLDRARNLPIAITHGSHDPIISVDFGREAKERLEAAGAHVSYFESEMPHAIDPRVMPQLQDWLAELP